MAAAFESISTKAYASTVDSTVTKPTGTVEGDLLLAGVFMLSGTTALTPPDGWTIAPGTWPIAVDSGVDSRQWVYYKSAGASEASSYTWSHASEAAGVTILRVSGADPTTPFDATPTTNQGTGATRTWTGLTTVTNGALLVAFGWDYADTSNDLTPPTGSTPTFTDRLDGVVQYVTSGVLATAGATGNKTQTNNGTPWASALIAVRPSGGGGSSTIVSPLLSFGPSYAAHRAASI